ncbi:MAG: hypothetical protein GY716_16780 [bacterium]|nr:hypothetical protein [bacterium]
MTELPESRLLTFIDEPREFAAYFFEGQRLIHDLALLNSIRGDGFAYFRDVVLSIQPTIALLKGGEQFGFYIDSAAPYFRLKIEAGHHGATRCMLLPEEFAEFPESMTGSVRLLKLFPRNRPPYESILEIEGVALRELVNRVLDESYQVNSSVKVSETSDQSLMLHQLPLLESQDDYVYSRERLDERRAEVREAVEAIFALGLCEVPEIADAFAEIGFRLIAHRPVKFHCSCSHARMVQNLIPVWAQEGETLFDAGETTLTVKCEYCKTEYVIARDEIAGAGDPSH